AADADGARPAAHAAQESHSRDLGQVRPPRPGGERPLRRTGTRPPAAASLAPAPLHGGDSPAPARASLAAGPPGARVRAPAPGHVQANPGDSTPADSAGRGAPARRGDRPRS